MPPVAKETIRSAVKSGFLKTSTSKFGPHGRTLISSGASFTNFSYLELMSLSTIATKPVGWPSFLSEWTVKAPTCLPTQRGRHTDPRNFRKGWIAFNWRMYVDVRLDEADITLDHWSNIFDPLDRSFLMRRNRARSKSIALSVNRSPLEDQNTHDSMYSSIILDWWSFAV